MSSGQPEFVSVTNTYVHLNISDGDPSRLPDVEPEEVDSNGEVDYLAEADEETVKHWKMKIGSYLVYEGDWYKPPHLQRFSLDQLPEHYKLYTHFKGKKNDPRRDTYLHGSATPRCRCFRSPEEFALHAKWLAYGCPKNENGKPKCGCCYCSNGKQSDISKYLKECVGDLFTNSAASQPTPSRTLQGPSRTRGRSATTPRGDAPIRAKDYTKLSETGEITTWVGKS